MAIRPILTGWQEAYLDFLGSCTDDRTQEQFASDHNISWSAVYVWRTKNYDFVYAEADKRRQQFKSQLRERAFKALGKRLDKSDKAIELALTLTGDLDAKASNEHYHFMGPDEKREKAWEYIKKLKETKAPIESPKPSEGNPA